MRPNVREVALGKWSFILRSLGVSENQLSGRQTPCPICGGKDRFRFDDLEGRGTWFCNNCRAGDGIKLVMEYKGWDFKTAAKEIETLAGVVQSRQIPNGQEKTEANISRLNKVWSEAKPLSGEDQVTAYLRNRGLTIDLLPEFLKFHPSLPYREDGRTVDRYPAMLAKVVGPDGTGLSIHRTYLQSGKKAPVTFPKKLMPGRDLCGGAIRLSKAERIVGIAEGIETALAASELFGLPVWSCISAYGIETFQPPPWISEVVIYGDNDSRKEFTGQIAAFNAGKRLKASGLRVRVEVPDIDGDWLDYLNAQRKEAA